MPIEEKRGVAGEFLALSIDAKLAFVSAAWNSLHEAAAWYLRLDPGQTGLVP